MHPGWWPILVSLVQILSRPSVLVTSRAFRKQNCLDAIHAGNPVLCKKPFAMKREGQDRLRGVEGDVRARRGARFAQDEYPQLQCGQCIQCIQCILRSSGGSVSLADVAIEGLGNDGNDGDDGEDEMASSNPIALSYRTPPDRIYKHLLTLPSSLL